MKKEVFIPQEMHAAGRGRPCPCDGSAPGAAAGLTSKAAGKQLRASSLLSQRPCHPSSSHFAGIIFHLQSYESDSQGFAADVRAKAEPRGEQRDLRQCLVGTQQPPPHQANTNTESPENAASRSPGDLPNMLERGGGQGSQLRDCFKVCDKF